MREAVTRLASRRQTTRATVERELAGDPYILTQELAQLLYEDAIATARELVHWPKPVKGKGQSRPARLTELSRSDAPEDRLAAELYRRYAQTEQQKKKVG